MLTSTNITLEVLTHNISSLAYRQTFLFSYPSYINFTSTPYCSSSYYLPYCQWTNMFLDLHILIHLQDNCTYTCNMRLHFKFIKDISLKQQLLLSLSKFKRYWSPNHSAKKSLYLCPQASHLGLPICRPTSITECWCLHQPIVFTARLYLIYENGK